MPLCTINLPPKAGAGEAAPPIFINGKRFPYAYGVPVDLPDEAIEVARGAGMALTIHDQDTHSPASDDAGNGDAAAGDEPGGEAGGGDTPDGEPFDPEAIIKGTVGDVAARLVNLTRDQLDAVKAAEDDREQPRTGVADAIAKALKAFDA